MYFYQLNKRNVMEKQKVISYSLRIAKEMVSVLGDDFSSVVHRRRLENVAGALIRPLGDVGETRFYHRFEDGGTLRKQMIIGGETFHILIKSRQKPHPLMPPFITAKNP